MKNLFKISKHTQRNNSSFCFLALKYSDLIILIYSWDKSNYSEFIDYKLKSKSKAKVKNEEIRYYFNSLGKNQSYPNFIILKVT